MNERIRITMPDYASLAIHLLENAGYEAYAVGGCVRDSILGIVPNDWDICTSALPSEIADVFSSYKTIGTGIKHGTVTVIVEAMPIEITTFRRDGNYTDNRHPDKVEFVRTLTDDLARRDFTVNAMAYSEKHGLIDLYGGVCDLKAGIIRSVGDAKARFEEDALRILRAIRFASRYGFDIEHDTSLAICTMAHLLKNVSFERISSELRGILSGKCGGKLLSTYGEPFTSILPFIPDDTSFKAIDLAPVDVNLRLAILLYTCPFDLTALLYKLRFDKKSADEIVILSKHLKKDIPVADSDICRMASALGQDKFVRLLQGKKALLKAQGCDTNPAEKCRRSFDRLHDQGRCPTPRELVLKGDDLIKSGYSEGKDIGRVQSALLEMIFCGKAENERESLLKLAEKLKS